MRAIEAKMDRKTLAKVTQKCYAYRVLQPHQNAFTRALVTPGEWLAPVKEDANDV
jgi:hypothetical protein